MFPADTKDPDWIRELGRSGDWVVITSDPRISKGKLESLAWRESKLTVFFLRDNFSNKDPYDQAAFLFRRWMDIVRLSKESPNGTGFSVMLNKVEIIYNSIREEVATT